MEDLNQIADALEEMGATVDRANFAAKMRDPAYVERVRSSLAEGGADVRDSAAFFQKWAPNVRPPAAQFTPRPVPEGLDAVSGAAYRPQAQASAASSASSQPPSVMEILFPRQQAAGRAGRGVIAGNVETAKDLVTLPFRTAAGIGSYAGTLGSELRQGGLDSPKDFGQALMAAKNQSEQDMSTVGADINYPGWAQGFVAPARDPVAAALALLPLGKPVGALAKALGAAGLGSGTLAPAASVASEALLSPIGQGLGIGATGAGIGLGMSAADRAVTPGASALEIPQNDIDNAIQQVILGGVIGGGLGHATRLASSGQSWLGGTVPAWLEKKAGRLVRASIKPNGIENQLKLEKALVEDRLLPEIVSNTTITPGGIARNYRAIKDPISQKIGVELAEADKAGPIYSSADAIQASRTAIADAIRRGVARATPAQEAVILRNIEEATQNHVPRSYGPWMPGQVQEAPMTASQAYNSKKINQNWAYDRLNTDPMMPQKARAEAALGLSRNFNQQLEQHAPSVKMLDRELAPYSAIDEAMETAIGPRSNRSIAGPTFWLSAGGISGGRQAWNLAQRLRALNGIRSNLPATLSTYLSEALQYPPSSLTQQPTRVDEQR